MSAFLTLSNEERSQWLENPVTMAFLEWVSAQRTDALERTAEESWKGEDALAARWSAANQAFRAVYLAATYRLDDDETTQQETEFIDPATRPSLLRKR